MKRILLLTLIGLLVLPTAIAFADGTTPMPVLISAPIEEELKEGYELIRGTVISYENQTLSLQVEGFEYPVTLYDRENAFANQLETLKEKDFVEVVGQYGEATFYLAEIVMVSPLMDVGAQPVLFHTRALKTEGTAIDVTPGIHVVEGVTMLPLRAVAEALGYQVSWNQDTQSVEVSKGAQWTSITLGENAYFKNRMAAAPLSMAPIALDGRTWIPVEFFTAILDLGIQVESESIDLSFEQMAIHSGYVHKIEYDETGGQRITISSVQGSEDLMHHTIIHASKSFTIYQTQVETGDFIHVISPPVMAMSIPGQTSGIVIY